MFAWWMAALLPAVTSNLERLFDSVWIFTPFLSPTTQTSVVWNPPLATALVQADCGQIPVWICGLLQSTAMTFVAYRAVRFLPVTIVAMWVACVSCCCPPESFMTLCLIVGVVALTCFWTAQTRTLLIFSSSLFGGIAATLLTADFGFAVWILVLSIAARVGSKTKTGVSWLQPTALAIVWTAGLVVASLLIRGFGQSLFRPYLRFIVPELEVILPSSSLQPDTLQKWVLLTVFCSILIRSCWLQLSTGTLLIRNLATSLGLAILSLGGWTGIVLAGCVLAAEKRPVNVLSGQTRHWPALLFCAAVACVNAGLQYRDFGADLIASRAADRFVNAGHWRLPARVLLTNLDQASDWYDVSPESDLRLITDGRECGPEMLAVYAQACMDFKACRRELFLRADGTWGGYAQPFRVLAPSVVVVDSSESDSLRRLALDPLWKPIGIDSRRVIFGSSEAPELQQRINSASRMLLHLEFQTQGAAGELRDTLVVGTRADAREVAMVLVCMRLPYAALKVLPDDDHSRTREVQAFAYAELAHRVRSQSGRSSLPDQLRAMKGLRGLLSSWTTSEVNRRRIRQAMDSLQLDDIRSSIPVSSESPDDAVGHSVDAEQMVRDAFFSGNPEEVRRLLDNTDETPTRRFYEAILAVDNSPEEAIGRLTEVVAPGDLSAALQHEALFCLGCLLLESGDSQSAVTRFRQAISTSDERCFQGLAELFLAQLTSLR